MSPKWLIRAAALVSFVLLLCFTADSILVNAQQSTPPPPSIAIILDASGSMQALIGSGQSRLAVAKEAIISVASELPSDAVTTLWVYGHRLSQADPTASCQDIQQVIPLGAVNVQAYQDAITSLNAIGYTPIATTLQLAADSLPPGREKLIILMSDGEESCGGDPCAVAQTLEASGIDIQVNTIGIAADTQTRAQLECIANATGGSYFDAQNASAVVESLHQASAPVLAPPTSTPAPTATSTPEPTLTFSAVPTITDTPLPTATATATATETVTPAPTPAGEQEGALPFNLSQTATGSSLSQYPQALLDHEDDLHVLWLDNSATGGVEDVLYRMRSPEGFWSPTENLSAVFFTTIPSSSRMVLTTDGVVCIYLVAQLDQNSLNAAYQRCRVNGAWSDPIKQPEFTQVSGLYNLAYDARNQLQGIYDNGNNIYFMGTDEQLTNTYNSVDAQFAIDSAGGYHVVWMTIAAVFTIDYRYSPDGGVTWTTQQTVSINENGRGAQDAQLAADSAGGIHLLYSSNGQGGNAIEYRKWTPGGWSDAVKLAQTGSESKPELAISPDNLAAAAWHVLGGIEYSHQLPDGTWTTPVMVAQEQVVGTDAALAVDHSGLAHLIWHDTINQIIDYTHFAFDG